MGKKGPLWWRESDWLLRGSSAANQILLRHSGPILSSATELGYAKMVANLEYSQEVNLLYSTTKQSIYMSAVCCTSDSTK